MRRLVVDDWGLTDLLGVGDVRCVEMRPQRIVAAEPYCLTCETVARAEADDE